MLCCDISDKLLDKDRLTYSGTSEKAYLTAFLIGAEKVYDLDARFKYFRLGGLLGKSGSFSVYGHVVLCLYLFSSVDGFAEDIENMS